MPSITPRKKIVHRVNHPRLADVLQRMSTTLDSNGKPVAITNRRNTKKSLKKRRSFSTHYTLKENIKLLHAMKHSENNLAVAVTDVEDWITTRILQERYLNGHSTTQCDEHFLTPPEFKLTTWVYDKGFADYTFVDDDKVLIEFETGYISIRSSDKQFYVKAVGDREFVDCQMDYFRNNYDKPKNSVNWVYDENGREISVPLNYRPAIQSAYPWITTPLKEYIKNYLNSDSCVLILIGPPGTGKTTFIKNIISESGGDAKVAYNTKVLDSDGFFAHFIESSESILVLEDADNFLSSRQDGNSMMHRFLNVSDGLISTTGKKLIFSTNLPNVSDVDSALMRPGRCYDVIQFRNLTRDEATEVIEEANLENALPDGSDFSLAEIFNSHPHTNSIVKRKIGF